MHNSLVRPQPTQPGIYTPNPPAQPPNPTHPSRVRTRANYGGTHIVIIVVIIIALVVVIIFQRCVAGRLKLSVVFLVILLDVLALHTSH